MFRYFLLNKPYNVICQFTPDVKGQITLADLYDFPKEVYPVGRLDLDSEGLLILTDDRSLSHRLLNPAFQHERVYWAQVEGCPADADLEKFSLGVQFNLDKNLFTALPARARLLTPEPAVWPRDPPIRTRRVKPVSWIEISLMEGKNRQVRKMCAAVGFPVLRLVRSQIENLCLDDLLSGTVKELSGALIYEKLRIEAPKL